MKIYWYWPHPHRATSELALAVLRDGDDLTVQALPSLNGETFDSVRDYEVVRDLPDPSIRGRSRFSRLSRRPRLAAGRIRARGRLARQGFDVGHLFLLDYQVDLVQLGRLARQVALVSTVHDVRPHDRRLPHVVETALLRRLYERAGTIVVAHEVLAEELANDFGVNPDRVHVLPFVFPQADMRDKALARPDRPFALLLGSLRENKGIEVLIAAARLCPELDVVIAGHGRSAYERKIAELSGQCPSVRFEPGFVSAERKRELLSTATVALMPYTSFHSQSAALGDAYCHRLASIVTDVGALGPTVRRDGTGVVVPPGDVNALAEALTRALYMRPSDFEPSIAAAVRRHSATAVGNDLRRVYDIAAANR